MLWGRRSIANKYHWRVWGVLPVCGPLGLRPLMACVLSQSALLRLQAALQGNCLTRALGCVHFPGLPSQVQVLGDSTKAQTRLDLSFVPFTGLSSSGNQVLGECTLPSGRCILSPPQSQPLGFPGAPQERRLRCALCLLWALISDCDPPGRCQPSRIPGRLR